MPVIPALGRPRWEDPLWSGVLGCSEPWPPYLGDTLTQTNKQTNKNQKMIGKVKVVMRKIPTWLSLKGLGKYSWIRKPNDEKEKQVGVCQTDWKTGKGKKCFKTLKQPGALAHTCNLSILGGQGGWITWGWEFETSLTNTEKPCLYLKKKKRKKN